MPGFGLIAGAAWRATLAAIVLVSLDFAPALADPAADVATQTEAVEAALAAKAPEKAEVLARAAVSLAESTFGAESPEAANLDRLLGDSLFDQKRYADAEPYYRRAFAIREAKLGEGSLDTVVSANDLAIVLKRLERYPESETFYRKVVDLRTAIQGPNDPATARALYFLASIIDAQGRYGEAAEEMATAVATASIAYGARDPTTVEWMGLRAAMLHDSGDIAGAEPAYLEANRLGEEVFEAGDTRLAYTRQSLANLYYNAGRPAEAAPLYRLALTAREAAFGAEDPATISALDGLAHALWAAGESEGAGKLFERLLAYREKTEGTDAASVADVLRMIGWSADRDNRKADAEIAFKRVIEISEAKLGPNDPYTALDLIALGTLYSGQLRLDEARPLLVRGIAILEARPQTAGAAASARTALALIEQESGNGPEAIRLVKKSLDDIVAQGGKGTREVADVQAILAGLHLEAHELDAAEAEVTAALQLYVADDPDGRSTLRAQSTLAAIRHEQGRLDDALALQRQVLSTLSARYGADSSEVWTATAEVAGTLLDMGDAAGAADAFGRAAAIVGRLAALDARTAFAARTGAVEDQALAAAKVYDGLLISEWQMVAADASHGARQADAAFLVAQRVIDSRAANAQAQMTARAASGSPELAALVRGRQDLVARWQRDDEALTAAVGAAASPTDTAPMRDALAATDEKIHAIDATLAEQYPAFADLQHPAPLTVSEVQARLGENEVLLFYADTGVVGGTGAVAYVWVVPKTGDATWVRLAQGPAELRAGVAALREAMGVGVATRGPTAIAKAQGPDRTERVLTAAHELYDVLLGDIAPLIDGKALLIVPSRSLAALPFHALVREMPPASSADRFREAGWVAGEHAIAVLPAVTSSTAPTKDAGEDGRTAYVAFANPLLTGRGGDDRRAFARTGCAPGAAVEGAEAAELPALPSLFRGAEADVAAVRALPPLPETADEVCAIAATLGAEAGALHIGAAASEANVKALSADGTLQRARTVHFATHGLVSGDLTGLAEPAIVLTPPDAASADDDGLLTASEVTGLKLDADWVILSACNTAAGEAGGEALSGLARAFFYAGARALLVSHWPVSSEAAVRLTTGAMAALEADPGLSKAEAMRRAMVAEIARGGVAADPVSWAPFIVVGE